MALYNIYLSFFLFSILDAIQMSETSTFFFSWKHYSGKTKMLSYCIYCNASSNPHLVSILKKLVTYPNLKMASTQKEKKS